MAKMQKLDTMALSALPADLTTLKVKLSDGQLYAVDLDEVLTLGDSYENPHAITHALDKISAFKAFWSSQAAQYEAGIDQAKEQRSVLKAKVKAQLPDVLKNAGRKVTIPAVDDAFEETAVHHATLSTEDAKQNMTAIAVQWGGDFAEACQAYRKVARNLRRLEERLKTITVLIDALSTRSFSLTKMADLADIMLKQGLIMGDEGAID